MWTDGENIYYMTSFNNCRVFDRVNKIWRKIDVYDDSDDAPYLTNGSYVYYDYAVGSSVNLKDASYYFGRHTFNKSSHKWVTGIPYPAPTGNARSASSQQLYRLPDKLIISATPSNPEGGDYYVLSGDQWTTASISTLIEQTESRYIDVGNIWTDCINIFYTKASWSSGDGYHRTACYKYVNGVFREINIMSDDNSDKCGCNVWTDGINVYNTEGNYNYSINYIPGSNHIFDRQNNIWVLTTATCQKKDGNIVTSDQISHTDKSKRFPIVGERVWSDGVNIFCSSFDGNTYIFKNKYKHTSGNYFRFAAPAVYTRPGNKFYRK